MARDDIYPTGIKGKILLSDGTETSFSILPDTGWQQWGNARNQEGATVDLMDALAEATSEHLLDPEAVQEEITEFEAHAGDYNDPGSKWNVEADMLGDD